MGGAQRYPSSHRTDAIDGYRFAPPILRRRLPILRRHLEGRKIESGRDGAADQCPVTGALGGLPGVRRHDRLRLLAGGEVRAESETPLPVVVSNLQRQSAAGVVMPDL